MRLSALLLSVVLAASAQAQGQNNYGSIYSLYGVGERVEFGSSQSAMLGHASTALRSGVYVNLQNPALWSDQSLTSFSAGASLATVRAEDGLSDAESVGTAGDLSSLHLGIPLLPNRLGLTLSYRPYSRVNYRAAIDDSLDVEGVMSPFTVNQEGSGGLQQFSAGLGTRFGGDLAVQLGASADVLFGSLELLQRTEFDDAGFEETRQARVTRLRGVTATLGAAVTARGLAAEDDALTVAGALSLPTSLGASRTVTLGESLDRDTLLVNGQPSLDGDVDIPLGARVGVTYLAGLRWLATLDASYEPWSGFESTLPVGGFNSNAGLDLLQDRYRVGGGVEVTPGGRDRRAGLFQRSSYRIGGYAEQGLYAPDGQNVNTVALTGGVSIPNRITGARFDVGFELGTRGSTEGVLVRDTFLKGTLTLNFGERWFVRRRFD